MRIDVCVWNRHADLTLELETLLHYAFASSVLEASEANLDDILDVCCFSEYFCVSPEGRIPSVMYHSSKDNGETYCCSETAIDLA